MTHLKTYMLKSIQLAIIQAFTAPCKIKFEQTAVILKSVLIWINVDIYVSNLTLSLDQQMIIIINILPFSLSKTVLRFG